MDLVKANPQYGPRCQAFVCDISQEAWPGDIPVEESSLDIVICLFVFSALDPQDMKNCVKNVHKYLKPGGKVLFRDYGRYDLAQLRFKPGKCLADNFYVRGDGTKCYFFTEDDVKGLFGEPDFVLEQCKVDRRLQVNRGKKLKMYRVWIQCKFTKK